MRACPAVCSSNAGWCDRGAGSVLEVACRCIQRGSSGRAAFAGKTEPRWTAPCFASDSLAVDLVLGNTLRVIMDTAQRQEALGCGDAYLGKVTDYHLLEPHLGGAYIVEWQGLEQVRSHPRTAPRFRSATRQHRRSQRGAESAGEYILIHIPHPLLPRRRSDQLL